jgi:hypothetical protein
MAEYRILVFDYGHVNASHTITARDDADAIEQARALLQGHDLEVWQQARFVRRLKPQTPGSDDG